jgi:hypothetical protein
MELPAELVALVLAQLDPVALHAAAGVSRHWRQCALGCRQWDDLYWERCRHTHPLLPESGGGTPVGSFAALRRRAVVGTCCSRRLWVSNAEQAAWRTARAVHGDLLADLPLSLPSVGALPQMLQARVCMEASYEVAKLRLTRGPPFVLLRFEPDDQGAHRLVVDRAARTCGLVDHAAAGDRSSADAAPDAGAPEGWAELVTLLSRRTDHCYAVVNLEWRSPQADTPGAEDTVVLEEEREEPPDEAVDDPGPFASGLWGCQRRCVLLFVHWAPPQRPSAVHHMAKLAARQCLGIASRPFEHRFVVAASSAAELDAAAVRQLAEQQWQEEVAVRLTAARGAATRRTAGAPTAGPRLQRFQQDRDAENRERLAAWRRELAASDATAGWELEVVAAQAPEPEAVGEGASLPALRAEAARLRQELAAVEDAVAASNRGRLAAMLADLDHDHHAVGHHELDRGRNLSPARGRGPGGGGACAAWAAEPDTEPDGPPARLSTLEDAELDRILCEVDGADDCGTDQLDQVLGWR